MKTSAFLRRVRQCLREVDPTFYKQKIDRRNKLLLKRAEEENRKLSGESLGQICDPNLRLVWAIHLCIHDYIVDRIPQGSEIVATVTGIGNFLHPFFALGMIRDGLQLALFLSVSRGEKIEAGSALCVGADWHLVRIPISGVKTRDYDRSEVLERIDFLFQGITMLEISSSVMRRMLVSFGHGDVDITSFEQ